MPSPVPLHQGSLADAQYLQVFVRVGQKTAQLVRKQVSVREEYVTQITIVRSPPQTMGAVGTVPIVAVFRLVMPVL